MFILMFMKQVVSAAARALRWRAGTSISKLGRLESSAQFGVECLHLKCLSQLGRVPIHLSI